MILDVYKDLEDSLFDLVSKQFPDWRTIFSFQNGPEPKTPYLLIDVKRLDSVGAGQNSGKVTVDTDTGEGTTTTTQDYKAKVRFEFVGKYENNTSLAEMVHAMEASLRTQRGLELQRANNLSLYSVSGVERVRLPRDTDMYMYYQLDVVFGYCIQIIEEQQWIEAVTLIETSTTLVQGRRTFLIL